MEMRVGQRSASLRDDDKFIPIYNEELGGYTLWVNDDPQAPAECREYAHKVAAILNTAPALQAENERLREALQSLLESLETMEVDTDPYILPDITSARAALAKAAN